MNACWACDASVQGKVYILEGVSGKGISLLTL